MAVLSCQQLLDEAAFLSAVIERVRRAAAEAFPFPGTYHVP